MRDGVSNGERLAALGHDTPSASATEGNTARTNSIKAAIIEIQR